MREADLQRAVLLALTEHCAHACRVWRANTGKMRNPRGRLISFGINGQADLTGMLIPSGKRLEIELKVPGKQLRRDQELYRDCIRMFGGVYLVVHSAQEAVDMVMDAWSLGQTQGSTHG